MCALWWMCLRNWSSLSAPRQIDSFLYHIFQLFSINQAILIHMCILHVVLQDWTSAVNLLIDGCSKLARHELSRVCHMYNHVLSIVHSGPGLQTVLSFASTKSAASSLCEKFCTLSQAKNALASFACSMRANTVTALHSIDTKKQPE